ncbi:membrane spanning protein ribonuclease BN-like family [Candidatus Scalindua japonica]|uniref:Membrane spanning protein ribonuclease BN-like family n=1 Tax=Candidatus Scalindua japonica TaxID=1284222 RepID=A0A286TY91_9BACT|nr:YihY/virulence factor BrkB family protein [Candidatus Scalindua japonica]GAX60836.1 membrane spanning protein ribonuclease BN-like family [Candidatus Scalindua japonica]
MKTMLSEIIDYVTTDIWRIRLQDHPRKKIFLITQLRVVILAFRGFYEDKCTLRASALTFYSLLSIVPVVALIFGIAKGFGSDQALENQLLKKFPGQEEVLVQVMGFARSLLEQTKGGMVAGIGLAVLFWIVIKLLSNIEHSFNDIWGIKKSRSTVRKITDYISIMLICPVLIIVSSGITVFLITQITLITERFAFLGFFSPLIFLSFKLLPYCAICGAFTFIYIFMPNTKVRFLYGVIAGAIAAVAYQVAQWGYIYSQVGVAQYNAIYGSFAALPLFLIWLQISWLIVLFGAEISFALQNIDTYEFEPDCSRVSLSYKRLLALQITHLIIKNFSDEVKPLTASKISHTLEIPIRLVHQILYELVECGIAVETNIEEDQEFAYQPACTITLLTIKHVIDALDKNGTNDIPVAQNRELKILTSTLDTFNDTIEKSSANKLLKDI